MTADESQVACHHPAAADQVVPRAVDRFGCRLPGRVLAHGGRVLAHARAHGVGAVGRSDGRFVDAAGPTARVPAGVVADVVDRRKVVVFAHALMAVAALAMAALWFSGRSSPALLLGLGLVLGTGVAFNLPVSHAIVPDLVPRGMVADAVALNSAGFNVARSVRPFLSGVVVGVSGPGTAFVLNAVSYVVTVVTVLRVRGEWDTEEESSVSSAIAIGLRFVRFTPPLRWLLGLVAAFALTSAVIQAVLPNLTSDVLDGGAGAY